MEVFSLRAAANENPATVVRAEVGLCGTRLCLLLSQVRCCICLKRVNFDAFVIVFRAEIPCPYYCPSVFCLFRVFKIF